MIEPSDDYDPYDDEECANCGGEGFVAACEEEWACVDPEGGCDLCMRRCDWCNPRKRPVPQGPQRPPVSTAPSAEAQTVKESNPVAPPPAAMDRK